jgi:DNA-binding SARP family transcriptional activator/ABC-type branched-subunit amino acid transport system substrate-binding protein
VLRGTFTAVLDFRILGPLEVRDREEAVHLGGTKQRGVLAILLLSGAQVVSTDRLIGELWGDSPPEDAAMALQAHVSRLRKALPSGAELLATQAPGYVLRLEDGQLDLDRFRRLSADGRAALAAGNPMRAADLLRSALDLWRGRPLADLEDEPFAREAAVHLEDAWLDAVGTRIEADFALGRHAEFVSELRALVRAHPLRESFCAQLMLALYRSGRQAEALEVYTDARRTLNEELGLEPGHGLQKLQQQILVQDLGLEAPVRKAAADSRRGRWILAVAAVVALASSAVVATAVLASGSQGPVQAASGGSLVSIGAESGHVGRTISVGSTPTAVAISDGSVWLLDADARTVSRIDPDSSTVSIFATGATPTDLAVGAGGVWVGNGRRLAAGQFVGPVTTSVARIDPVSKTERADVALPRTGGSLSNQFENRLAATSNALWAVAPDFSLARIDAKSLAVTDIVRPFPVQAVATGQAGVWVLGIDGEVARIDDTTGKVVARARVPASSVAAIAVGDDAAWVTSPSDGTLWRVVADAKPLLGSIDVGAGAGDVAVSDGSVWVANPLAGTVTQIAIDTTAVVRTVALGGVPRSIAAADGVAWVSLSNMATRAISSEATYEGLDALPATSCEPILYGGQGEPDIVIASDLMLQGGARVLTTQMVQAIAFVLRQHGFKAGDLGVAYQSCDDSVATTGLYDLPKCAANARAFAANPDVVGVVGTFNSPCSVAEIPILNRAPGGGLAMVSPSNSFVGLTRAGPGAPAEGLAHLYPAGSRNYVRVSPADDMQMAALALVVERLGHRRVAVLDDGLGYGRPLADAFAVTARRLGLQVVLHESWDPRASTYRGLVEAVGNARPQAVVLSGLLDTNGAEVVRELRGSLGRDVAILGNEGFTPISLFVDRAGASARGTYVSVNGLTLGGLGPSGRRFVRAFAAVQPGAEIQPSAVYAAQATEVLLDAIARSDGTRASVIEQLFETKVAGGLLGDFTFDENGDISEAPITILRVERGGGAKTILSVEGARIERIERPQTRLVR